MRKDTDKGHGLLGGTVAAVLVVGVVLLFLAVIVQTLGPFVPFLGQLGAGLGVLALYIIVILAIAVGVVAALVQRWREVKGGEEDEAKKY